MHELGIAQNILDIVQQSVPGDQVSAVKKIRIRVGRLSGVVPDSLEFCIQVLLNETEMKQAGLVMETIPTVSRCRDCRHKFAADDFVFSCPVCKSANLELISGRELEVAEIELSDDNDEEI